MFRSIQISGKEYLYPRIHILVSLDYGGSESQMLNLAQEYKRQGLLESVAFYSLTSGGIVSESLRELGFKVVLIGESPSIPNVRLIWKLVRQIHKENPEVVMTNGAEANFHGVIAARIARVRYITAEEIGIGNHGLIARIIFRLINMLTSASIAASPQVADHMLARREVSAGKISVIYAPIFFTGKKAEFRTLDYSTWKLLYLGRLELVKDIDLLLDALHILKTEFTTSNWSLILVGDGSERERLFEKVQALKLNPNVSFHGKSNEPEKFITNSHFLVQSSLSEGMGLSLAEALHAGTPVITTNVGIAGEVVETRKNGFLVDTHISKDFAKALFDATNLTEDEYQDMSASALNTDLARYSTDAYLQKVEEILRK